MHACRYLRDHHDSAQGATVVRRSVACALAALLTLAVPAADGIHVALADPSVPASDGIETTLACQSAPEFRSTPKVMKITRKKALIGEQEAVEIALADLGVKAETCGEIEVEFEDDESPAIYEIEFVHGATEHEYEIEAYTGKICEHEWAFLDNSPITIIRRQD